MAARLPNFRPAMNHELSTMNYPPKTLPLLTMIIFNDTVIVEEAVHEKWLEWMKETHIPAVMATGLFNSHQILNVIDSPNEGVTYCIQYHTDSLEKFNQFYTKHLHQLQALHNGLFENQYVIFNTLMQTVD